MVPAASSTSPFRNQVFGMERDGVSGVSLCFSLQKSFDKETEQKPTMGNFSSSKVKRWSRFPSVLQEQAS